MVATQDVREAGENPASLGPAAVDDNSTLEILKRLADLKEKEKQMKFERDEMNQKLASSKQEMYEMKRDVEILSRLEPSQYQQLEREMQEHDSAAKSQTSDSQSKSRLEDQ